jgi:Glycosyl hydrolase family 63 C-terminal domain
MAENAEEVRLREARELTRNWKRWGPYVSERSWGTVREDYSPDGAAWDYLPHDKARSKAYRWNEEGLMGFSDRHGMICFALAMWNGKDSILKERLFGVTCNQGNHGEDVKEYYFYLDSTPTHSYLKALYKYPQSEYPYNQLLSGCLSQSREEPELELLDMGPFAEDRYFDVFVEYAKADPEDILIRIEVINRGPESATIHLLPTIWFRNRWTWGDNQDPRPSLYKAAGPTDAKVIELDHFTYGRSRLYCEGAPELLFTENNTNNRRLYNAENETPYVKDGINDYVVDGVQDAVNPNQKGTKAAAYYPLTINPGASATVRMRLRPTMTEKEPPFQRFDEIFELRKQEANEFFDSVTPPDLSDDGRNVMRQAFAGLMWSKQFYHYVVEEWLDGDPAMPLPPPQRISGRNRDWIHLYNADVISMPDKWEYPWYAAWDLAFHTIPIALIDSDFAKNQLVLLLREWYMHPNGQVPAYEWAFEDVNPPVHAWAALRVYQIEEKRRGQADRVFLEKVFHKLLLNFTWWVNRKDAEGDNIFQGGFLGLDNIGLFDRNKPLPTGGTIEQSDGTSWMAMYTLNLLGIALELAKTNPAYEDVASKFWEHFVYIADAMNNIGRDGIQLWDERDGFYYDVMHLTEGAQIPMRVRSMVGLIPLFAVETVEPDWLDQFPGFKKRMEWFIENRPDLVENIASIGKQGVGKRRLVSLVNQQKLRSMLKYMLDEEEFLSPYGIRSVSRYHKDHPYILKIDGVEYKIDYEPAESQTGLFGGNSNWRGPIWFPLNYLIIESLQKFHHYFGDELKVECPTGSGKMMNLWEVSVELSQRLSRLFLRNEQGHRPVFGDSEKFQTDPNWRDHVLFYEYFHGDNGMGLGASHQTGWTALVAKLLQQSGEKIETGNGGNGEPEKCESGKGSREGRNG